MHPKPFLLGRDLFRLRGDMLLLGREQLFFGRLFVDFLLRTHTATPCFRCLLFFTSLRFCFGNLLIFSVMNNYQGNMSVYFGEMARFRRE